MNISQTVASLQAEAQKVGHRPLSERVIALYSRFDLSARLLAHAILVADVAYLIIEALQEQAGQLNLSAELICDAAALHDYGKLIHRKELSKAGHQHEQAGYELLRAQGVPEGLARSAQSHASADGTGLSLEELIVALADKLWKGKRSPELEMALARQIAGDAELWPTLIALDERWEQIADDAPQRLLWHQSFAV
jgi:putative nucleotidyltransferase with HDIG domain